MSIIGLNLCHAKSMVEHYNKQLQDFYKENNISN